MLFLASGANANRDLFEDEFESWSPSSLRGGEKGSKDVNVSSVAGCPRLRTDRAVFDDRGFGRIRWVEDFLLAERCGRDDVWRLRASSESPIVRLWYVEGDTRSSRVQCMAFAFSSLGRSWRHSLWDAVRRVSATRGCGTTNPCFSSADKPTDLEESFWNSSVAGSLSERGLCCSTFHRRSRRAGQGWPRRHTQSLRAPLMAAERATQKPWAFDYHPRSFLSIESHPLQCANAVKSIV